MKRRLLTSGFIVLFLIGFSETVFSQKIKNDSIKDRDWRIEVEPTSFIFRGASLHISRNITKNNRLNIGLYFLALDIPKRAIPGMFNEYVSETADVRLAYEFAVVARYSFPVAGINPYVGLIVGWERFDVVQSPLPGVFINTGVITPFIGHEIYVFRKMIFINPQLRGVFYVLPTKNPSYRPETMEPFFVLPALSVGIKI